MIRAKITQCKGTKLRESTTGCKSYRCLLSKKSEVPKRKEVTVSLITSIQGSPKRLLNTWFQLLQHLIPIV